VQNDRNEISQVCIHGAVNDVQHEVEGGIRANLLYGWKMPVDVTIVLGRPGALRGSKQNTQNISLSFVLDNIFISEARNSDLPKNTSMRSGLYCLFFFTFEIKWTLTSRKRVQ
jgi:hypothetical protein